MTRVAAGDLLCRVLSRTGAGRSISCRAWSCRRRCGARGSPTWKWPSYRARPQLLSSLDCLIFDNIATSSMLQAQKDALSMGERQRPAGGDRRVDWQRTISSLPPELLPVKVSGLASLEDLGALAELGRAPIGDTARGWSPRRS